MFKFLNASELNLFDEFITIFQMKALYLAWYSLSWTLEVPYLNYRGALPSEVNALKEKSSCINFADKITSKNFLAWRKYKRNVDFVSACL